MVDHEEPLRGGGMAPVVRVGDTVRRKTGPWTAAVHALLRYLDAVGFDGVPRVLGIDQQGREVLSYIQGDPRIGHFPTGIDHDAALVAAARLIHRYHDAVAGFVPPAGSAWRFMVGAPRDGIVCHNDLGPANTVYTAGQPRAFIDWDFAAPASPVWDLAYAAWRFVGLYSDEDCRRLGFPADPRGPRLRLFCDAYGLQERDSFVDLIRARQQALYDTVRALGEAGDPDFAPIWHQTRGEQWLRTMRYLDSQRAEWQSHLMG